MYGRHSNILDHVIQCVYVTEYSTRVKSAQRELASHDPIQGSHDPTQPSRDPTQASHDPMQASHDPTQASHDPTQASHDPTQPSHNLTQELGVEQLSIGEDYILILSLINNHIIDQCRLVL